MLFVLYWYELLLAFSGSESLHVCTACIWSCEHASFCVEVFMHHIYKKNLSSLSRTAGHKITPLTVVFSRFSSDDV